MRMYVRTQLNNKPFEINTKSLHYANVPLWNHPTTTLCLGLTCKRRLYQEPYLSHVNNNYSEKTDIKPHLTHGKWPPILILSVNTRLLTTLVVGTYRLLIPIAGIADGWFGSRSGFSCEDDLGRIYTLVTILSLDLYHWHYERTTIADSIGLVISALTYVLWLILPQQTSLHTDTLDHLTPRNSNSLFGQGIYIKKKNIAYP